MRLDHRRPQKQVCIFSDIGALYTLRPAAKKSGRKILFDDLGLIKNAAFVTLAGKILWLGEEKKLPKEYSKLKKDIKKISFDGATLLPGFIESHTHMIFAGSRAHEFDWRNQGVTYQEISKKGGGILSTLKQTRQAKAQDLLEHAQKNLDDFIRQGVTTLETKSGYALNAEGEKKLLNVAGQLKKIRVVRTYLGAHSLPPEFKSTSDYIDQMIAKDLPEIARRRLAERVDIFVEKGFFSVSDGRRYFDMARKLGLDTCVHADQLSLSGGAELAIDYGSASADHLIQIGEHEISRLAKSEVTCTLLPGADLYMKCAYPPARGLIDAGARVALATDFNPGTSPTQDLSLIGVLARVEMKMTLAEVIAAYTIGAAYALRLEKEMGSLEVGKAANFVVLESGIDELFYQIGKSPVRQTWFAAEMIFSKQD